MQLKRIVTGLFIVTSAFLGAPTITLSQTLDPALSNSPIASYANDSTKTYSGIFRPKPAGVAGVVYDTRVLDTEFFKPTTGTQAARRAAGYELISVDVWMQSETRLISGVFQKDGLASQLWILTEPDFKKKADALRVQGQRLVDVTTYFQNGQQWYVGVFRPGQGRQFFLPGLTFSQLAAQATTRAASGHFLTNVEAYVNTAGAPRYAGVWSFAPQGSSGYFLWDGDWNTLSKAILDRGAQGQRLVDLSAYVHKGRRRYVGVWLNGTADYQVVAATTKSVFDRKVGELAAARGLVPAVIETELGYMPPVGFAAAMHDRYDATHIGYSYAILEHGAITAVGANGEARAARDPNPRAMTSASRMDIASMSKAITAAAVLKLLEGRTDFTVDTPFMKIFGNKYKNVGTGVADITLADLLRHQSGLTYVDPCDNAKTIEKPANAGVGYSNENYCILREVVETLSKSSFLGYLQSTFFGRFNMGSTDCERNNTLPELPLYYLAGSALNGWNGDEAARSRKVCGTGGFQSTAGDMAKFMLGIRTDSVRVAMTTNADVEPGTTPYTLGGLDVAQTLLGNVAKKSGGYPAEGPGQGGALAFGPDDTQVFVNANTRPTDPDALILDGLVRMQRVPMATSVLVNRNTSLCVDVQGADRWPPAPLIQWGCTGGDNQKFVFHHVASTTSVSTEYVIEAGHSGMCADVAGGKLTEGTNLDQQFCTGGDKQMFAVTPTGGGYWQIRVRGSNQCVSTRESTNTGSSIVIDTCDPGTKSQEFSIPGLGQAAVATDNTVRVASIGGGGVLR